MKHIRTLELKWKIDVTVVYSKIVKFFVQEKGVDPYHIDLVLIFLFLCDVLHMQNMEMCL